MGLLTNFVLNPLSRERAGMTDFKLDVEHPDEDVELSGSDKASEGGSDSVRKCQGCGIDHEVPKMVFPEGLTSIVIRAGCARFDSLRMRPAELLL
jgi:hypothetical protein